MVAKEPERVISRRAIAQGMSDVLRCPVCSCAHFLCTLRMRPRVQRASGIPCALFLKRGATVTCKPRAFRAARSRTHIQLSSPRRRRSSIPETPMIDPRSRGVLDTRLRGYDSFVWSGYRDINSDINDIGPRQRARRPRAHYTPNIPWRFRCEWPKACLSHSIPSGHVARAAYRDGSFDRLVRGVFNVSGAKAP